MIMKKIAEFIKQYVLSTSLFLLLGVLLKIGETVYFITSGETIPFTVFVKSVLVLTIVYCFYSVLMLPIYTVFNFINKKLARIFISIVFSLLLLFETGLTVYLFNTGTLIGAELIIRPISEVVATITTIVSIWIPILGIIAAPLCFYLIISFLNRKTWIKKITLPIAIITIIFSALITFMPTLYHNAINPNLKNYIQNKSLFGMNSIITYLISKQKNSTVNFEKERIKEFLQENPGRKIINKKYPFERQYENHNVLAPYFKPDTIRPNIVIIVLESLGREWSHPNPNGLSFTPFFDSLAYTGLYWKNCISTTRRSFGIVPSITGSLPFGVKGFQFGAMPEHHSLIKILKSNSYKTNAFYAGAFYFDAINDYLLIQDIDYMSEVFYKDYEKNQTEHNGIPYWGYHDSIMFAKALQDPNILNNTTPLFNLFVTTSGHQDADKNNPYFQRAYKLANQLISTAPKEKQEAYLRRMNRGITILYQDLCLREFFEQYKKREDFENTIFVLTGDHASGLMVKNDLSAFHVPLVIWSPLLLKSKTFPAVVSHNDFVPTIEALLREHYNIEYPKYIHWLGNSLDTSLHFNSKIKTVMFDYSDGYKDLIYNNYYYNGKLYEIINENVELQEIQNESLSKFMSNKLDLYRYIHQYTYLNNKLTTQPFLNKENYQTIKDVFIQDSINILFETAPNWAEIIIYPDENIDGEWKKIKISIIADIMFLAIPENNEHYELIIECKGTNMKNADYYQDDITSFIMVENLETEKWYPLHIEKQFFVEGASDIKIKMYFCIGSNKPKNHTALKNIRFLIEGVH